MRALTNLLLTACLLLVFSGCSNAPKSAVALRQPVDTIGFSHRTWQTDTIIKRIGRNQSTLLSKAGSVFSDSINLKVALSPHDDYSYVGYLYPALFKNVRSKVVIMFGVAHKAKNFSLQDRIVFGTVPAWKSPAGQIRISPLKDKIMKALSPDMYVVNDSMMNIEHSLEGLVPLLEHYNTVTEIIPILVPFCSFERMDSISVPLASAIDKVMRDAGLTWGKGYSILLSSDAVHYGNEEWGGKNYDRYGVDTTGYRKAVNFEKQIEKECFEGTASKDKVKAFYDYTVSSEDYHDYKWTWCGRYSIPMGMLTAIKISETEGKPLNGKIIGYSTSIANDTIPVHDLGMGRTAIAKLTHWVGYAAVGFE